MHILFYVVQQQQKILLGKPKMSEFVIKDFFSVRKRAR